MSKYDRVTVVLPKGSKAKYRAAALRLGVTVGRLIRDGIRIGVPVAVDRLVQEQAARDEALHRIASPRLEDASAEVAV